MIEIRDPGTRKLIGTLEASSSKDGCLMTIDIVAHTLTAPNNIKATVKNLLEGTARKAFGIASSGDLSIVYSEV